MGTFFIKENIGRFFNATIKKEIELPDGKLYYLIEDEFGLKHTLPKQMYSHYEFTIGKSINIRLDHINCDNRLFFEPENPLYKEGKTYEFKIEQILTEENFLGFQETMAIVIDAFGKKQKVRYISNTNNKSHIKAFVALIKKGHLYLLPENLKFHNLKPNTNSEFKIIGTKQTERFGDTFIVIDRNNNKHGIPIKYYKNYRLKEKNWFKAEVQKISSKGFLYIEPLHPIYRKGQIYSFKIFNKLTHKNEYYYFVEDCFGNIVKVAFRHDNIKIGAQIKCNIIGLSKGIPQLKLIEN